MKFEEIKEPLKKVLETLSGGKSPIGDRYGNISENITAESLEKATGNHMCDDHPEWFGITKNEGHEIRSYFQGTGLSGRIYRDYVELLHKEFPEFMGEEHPMYVRDTNLFRRKDHPVLEM